MASKGGLFGAAERPAYSKETHNLLKVMMEESRLTNFQRRSLKESMQNGRSLPVEVGPTSRIQKKKAISSAPPPRGVVSSNMRTIDKIEESGAYEREQYVPKPIRSLEREKERLCNLMAYGEEVEMPKKRKQVKPPPSPKDRFDEIQEEIAERQNFLDEMIKLGQGEKYRAVISTQISQLIREMEEIDKKRNAELDKILDAN